MKFLHENFLTIFGLSWAIALLVFAVVEWRSGALSGFWCVIVVAGLLSIITRDLEELRLSTQAQLNGYRVGDRVSTRTGRGDIATIVHMHDGVAWLDYGNGRNGHCNISNLNRVEA